MEAAQEETQEGSSGSPGEEGVVEVVAAVGIPLPRLDEARTPARILRLPAGGLLELAAGPKTVYLLRPTQPPLPEERSLNGAREQSQQECGEREDDRAAAQAPAGRDGVVGGDVVDAGDVLLVGGREIRRDPLRGSTGCGCGTGGQGGAERPQPREHVVDPGPIRSAARRMVRIVRGWSLKKSKARSSTSTLLEVVVAPREIPVRPSGRWIVRAGAMTVMLLV
jgi:hypothetical protein